MMATDSRGSAVQYGDYVAVQGVDLSEVQEIPGTIVRIVSISETPKGIKAIGAYVDLIGTGRVAKVPVDIAAATLLMKSDGTGCFHEDAQ